MCKVIAIANQKGGVGKTSLAANLGIGLTNRGKKVLLIDGDPQGSLTKSLGYQTYEDTKNGTLATVFDSIINDRSDFDPDTCLLHHRENITLLPSDKHLEAIETQLVVTLHREFRLKKYIDIIRDEYDYILIDCMPSLGLVTINALVAADSVIVPLQPQFLSLKGLEQLIETINMLRDEGLNPFLTIDGLLLTMVNLRTVHTKQIIKKVMEYYGPYLNIFDTYIPHSIRASETAANGTSIFLYDPKGKVAKAYSALTEEVLSYA